MKGNEEASAKALEQLLTKLGLTCSWKPVKPDNSFPDFDFNVEGEKWAVECTDLHQYVDQDRKATSRIGVDKGLERLCEAIRFKAEPGVNRRYMISAFGPDLKIERKEIEQRALDYISSGKTEREALDLPEIDETDPAKAEVLRHAAEEQAKVHIRAFTEEVPITYAYGLDGAVKNADGKNMAADIMATLRYSVKRILDEKLPKLVQCTSYQRRILLVWRGFWIAEPRQVRDVLDEFNINRSELDTFLLVLPNGEVHWVADPGELFTRGTPSLGGPLASPDV